MSFRTRILDRLRGTARDAPPAATEELLLPGIVHELRQPLTGLDAGLRLAARELGPAATELDGWKLATAQLARIQETLATYQQLMSPVGAEHGPFAALPVVRRAVDGLRFRLEPLHERFAVVTDADLPSVHGSAQALHHAVTNLLANAADAVEEAGAGRVEVRLVRAAADGARVQVRVSDEGVGIPAAWRRRLFRPRFTTKARGRGTGLGLAISRRMMRSAGGEVRLARDDDPARRPWARTEFVIELATDARSPVPHEPTPGGRKRAAWAGGAAAAALLALSTAFAWAGFQRPVHGEGATAAAPAAATAPDRVEVLEASGVLERLRGDRWEPLAPRTALAEDDTLRTGPGARATIAIGDRSRITVSDASQLTVREIAAAVQRLRLTRGRLSVDHQPGGARVLVIESERGDAVARAGTARFNVLANGAALAVATEAGVVRLQAADRTVDVPAGQQSISFRGTAPTMPSRVPVQLLLRVARAARQADGGCTVEGTAEPGAEVQVDGRRVEPGPDGRFSARLERGERVARSTVVTRDASGRVVQRRVACVRDAVERDVSDFAVRWGHDASSSARLR